MVTYKSLNNFTMSHQLLKTNNLNYVYALLAAVFVVSSGVSSVYAAPDSPPTLKLVKSVITDDGGQAVADDWVLFATAEGDVSPTFFNSGGSGIFEPVLVGIQYTLSESDFPAGYVSDVEWSCNGGTFEAPNIITLSLGNRITCTITNDDIAPMLKLTKVVVNDNGGTAIETDWTLTATGSGSNAKRNISTLGGEGVLEPIFANALYTLAEVGDNLAYTAANDGNWICTITYPNGESFTISRPISAISLHEGDEAECTITNDDDVPSISLEAPSKINGKLTLSTEVKGFENTVPVNYKVYKMEGNQKSLVYEGYVSAAPYSFSVSPKVFDAGSSYLITANADDKKGKSATNSIALDIPAKGNTG